MIAGKRVNINKIKKYVYGFVFVEREYTRCIRMDWVHRLKTAHKTVQEKVREIWPPVEPCILSFGFVKHFVHTNRYEYIQGYLYSVRRQYIKEFSRRFIMTYLVTMRTVVL